MPGNVSPSAPKSQPSLWLLASYRAGPPRCHDGKPLSTGLRVIAVLSDCRYLPPVWLNIFASVKRKSNEHVKSEGRCASVYPDAFSRSHAVSGRIAYCIEPCKVQNPDRASQTFSLETSWAQPGNCYWLNILPPLPSIVKQPEYHTLPLTTTRGQDPRQEDRTQTSTCGAGP